MVADIDQTVENQIITNANTNIENEFIESEQLSELKAVSSIKVACFKTVLFHKEIYSRTI